MLAVTSKKLLKLFNIDFLMRVLDLYIAWRCKKYMIESTAKRLILHLFAPTCTGTGLRVDVLSFYSRMGFYTPPIHSNGQHKKNGQILISLYHHLTNGVASSLLIAIGCEINVERLLPLAYPLRINNKTEYPAQYPVIKRKIILLRTNKSNEKSFLFFIFHSLAL